MAEVDDVVNVLHGKYEGRQGKIIKVTKCQYKLTMLDGEREETGGVPHEQCEIHPAGPRTPRVGPREPLEVKTAEKLEKHDVVRGKGMTWRELAAASGEMPSDGSIYRRVPEDDELLVRMRSDNGTGQFQRNPPCGPLPALLTPPLLPGVCAGDKVDTGVSPGIRIPFYYPLVTCSFASKNLSGDPAKRIEASDSLAGRDPWSICDYLRDSLKWPSCLIFIDAEQCGGYDLDHYHLDEKCIEGDPSKPCPFWEAGSAHERGTCGCEANPQFGEHDGSRNWKALFQWAQQSSHVMLYCISDDFFASDNCKNEFQDYCKMRREGKVTAAPVIALLDSGLKAQADKMMKQMSTLASEEGNMSHIDNRRCFSTDNVIDLSVFMEWKRANDDGRGGMKNELRMASREMQKLRDKIRDLTPGTVHCCPFIQLLSIHRALRGASALVPRTIQ
jgi:hypothetical protein